MGPVSSRVVLCALFAEGIVLLHYWGWPVNIPSASSIIPSVVLGLLLVFRTNTAYERYWEGRRLWGEMNNAIRNLARHIWVAIAETAPEDRTHKRLTIRLLIAFAVATKLHLRGQGLTEELWALLPADRHDLLHQTPHPPLEISFWIADYLQSQQQLHKLSVYELTAQTKLLDVMVNALGGCERILRTPLPMAYVIHLRQLLLIYCLSLPFQFVASLNWFTGLFVALITFTVFGIEAIGIEIENPFGSDPNDLPLDSICQTIQRNLEDLTALSPTAPHWQSHPPDRQDRY